MKKIVKRTFIGLYLVCALIALGIAGFSYFFVDEEGMYSLATLHSTYGYTLNIRAPVSLNVMVILYCKVIGDGETIFAGRIGYVRPEDLPKLNFLLIQGGENKEVVALVDQANPQIVIAIYDFTKCPSEQDSYKARAQLLKRLEHFMGKSFFWPGTFDDAEPRVYGGG